MSSAGSPFICRSRFSGQALAYALTELGHAKDAAQRQAAQRQAA
ncbi:hypothetical protein [Thiococcus pfennigii]|nr:hypothetical protein [Thiococcus pfennigii]